MLMGGPVIDRVFYIKACVLYRCNEAAMNAARLVQCGASLQPLDGLDVVSLSVLVLGLPSLQNCT